MITMAVFARASDEDRAARQAGKQAQRAAAEEERAAAEFWASPVGQARRAHESGDRFFQVQITHDTIDGYANAAWSGSGVSQRRRQNYGAPDLLGQVEAEGWRLEHASWVYVQTGQNSRDKFLASGQQVVVQGEVVGVYLFRAAADRREG